MDRLCSVCHVKPATVRQDHRLMCGTCAVFSVLYDSNNLPPGHPGPSEVDQFDFDRYTGVVGPSREALTEGVVDAVCDHVSSQCQGPCSIAALSDPVTERMVQCLAS